ncbi:MAG: hypothetical protein NTW11_00245 [Candidatus Staskawiczbacteria bacterium]|nr:hypothetical protein [Candidatus Staskawiczbacteria bacterium]
MGEIRPKTEDGTTEPQEPERTSGIVRVVGVSPEIENEALEFWKQKFDNQELHETEREKAPDEIMMIKKVLAHLSEFTSIYGGKPVPLKMENIHIIDPDQFSAEAKQKLGNTKGWYDLSSQSATIISDRNNIDKTNLFHEITHELMHFSEFSSLMPHTVVEKDGSSNTLMAQRRNGFSVAVMKDNKPEFYFNDLNEAITEELVARFIDKYLLSDQSVVSSDYFMKVINSLGHGDAEGSKFSIPDIDKYLMITSFSSRYNEEREKLWRLIVDIKAKNSDKFKSPEDFFNIFAREYFTGRLLPVARLIEKTYGKGSFRELGKETKAKNQFKK